MTVTTTVKKVVTDNTYAAVGVTDLAVERVRTAREQLQAVRAELAPKRVQAKLVSAPADARETYVDLTVRGEKLITRILNQKSTKDLVAQAEATLALGKGLVTTARKTATDVERSAKSTVTTGRKEAAKAAGALADSVSVEVDTDKAAKAVETSVKRTRTAAKRTTSTAKNGATRTRTSAKATGTSARKTAAKSTKAAEKAATKVGD